jgi:hypothetical protein
MATVISSDLAVALHVSVRTDRFHMTWGEPLRTIFLVALALHETYYVSQGIHDPFSLGIVVPALVLGLSIIGVAIVSTIFAFEVGPAGIRCIELWYRTRDWAWDDIAGAQTVSILGMPYLRLIGAPGKRNLWIPLFVTAPERLIDSLELHVPEDHPMRTVVHSLVSAV